MPRRSGGSSGSSRSSSSPRTYVDNSYNRAHGRVGMTVGSAVISRSTGSSSVGNSSSSSASSSRTYVDNSFNRAHGRVGLPLGSAVISNGSSRSSMGSSAISSMMGSSSVGNSCSSSSSSTRTYVDNSYNRAHGRVGLPLGSAVISKSTGSSSVGNNSSSSQPSPSATKTYVDNSYNRALGRVGLPLGSAVNSSQSASTASKTYVDNNFNRIHGRVGLPLGSAPVSSKSSKSTLSKKVYVDNALNRKLDRVGKPIGSMPCSKSQETSQLRETFKQWQNNERQAIEDPSRYQLDLNQQEMLQEILERMAIWEQVRESKANEYNENSQPDQVKNPIERSFHSQDPLKAYNGAVIEFDQIKIGEKIGSGGFGDIHSAKWDGKDVAVKKLRVQRVSKKRLDQFVDEIKVFYQLEHKNIVKFHGACIKTPNLCIVMELMEDSLFDKLHVNEHQFSINNKLFMVKEMSCGLQYLHSKEVAHCDIKSKNVLISIFGEDKIEVKFSDFGLSLMKQDTETTTSSKGNVVRNLGTPRYSAPEVLRGDLLDRRAMKFADVYSFSLVIHEVFTEEEPFGDLNIHQLREHVGNKGKRLPLDFFQQDPTDEKMVVVADILQRCWVQPEKRPSINEISNHLTKL